MNIDILAIGAHPDDVELGCGATVAKEIAAGKTVGILDLTRGELGTRGDAETRKKEAEVAAGILGARFRENAGLADGFFTDDKESLLALVTFIRRYRPQIVFCNAPDDRHPDHGRGSRLVGRACFLSGLKKVKTTADGRDQDPWRPAQVYYYIQWKDMDPDFVVEVSGFMEKKIEAVSAYKSQFYDPRSAEPETPISSQNFKDSIHYRARNLGRFTGVEYAEGFTTERFIAVESVFDLK